MRHRPERARGGKGPRADSSFFSGRAASGSFGKRSRGGDEVRRQGENGLKMRRTGTRLKEWALGGRCPIKHGPPFRPPEKRHSGQVA